MIVIAVVIILIALALAEVFLYRKRGFKRIEYKLSLSSDEVNEGDEIEIIEEISNGKLLPIPWFKTEIVTSRWLNFAGANARITNDSRYVPSFFVLGGYEKIIRRWHVKCTRRGVYRLDKINLIMSDLFGIVTQSKLAPVNEEVIVLPTPIRLDDYAISPQMLGGEMVIRRHIIEDVFEPIGIREYVDGDAMGKIHWKATASHGELMTITNEYNVENSITTMLNMQSGEYGITSAQGIKSLELGIKCAVAIFQKAEEIAMPFSLLANTNIDEESDEISSPLSTGKEHYFNIMRTLATIEPHSTMRFSTFLKGKYHSINTSEIAIITAYVDEDIINFVRYKSRSGIKVTVFLTAVITDEIPPDVPTVNITDRIDENSSNERGDDIG